MTDVSALTGDVQMEETSEIVVKPEAETEKKTTDFLKCPLICVIGNVLQYL